ncbi:DNA-processing protein DprA [Fangia hongkongensis]|uniref:DNA-processing protein DprA n=1 Tax=Fangia hongkongensis TaxID=270495 RepID=UPI00037D5EFD|nr:DNA-processing protein DprA [Fangia hongkongensis]MBK2123675.1 DNA-protecting protein DprA [Fangia hongkongensis]
MHSEDPVISLSLLAKFSYDHLLKLQSLNIELDDVISAPKNYCSILPEHIIDSLSQKDYLTQLEALMLWQKNSSHHLITITNPLYPPQLKEIAKPPLMLYVIGDPMLLESKQIAVVGARKHSIYAKEVIEHIIPALVSENLTITSGLAYGVDALAHQSTLNAKGKTIAVLGTGINKCYPYQNKSLYETILKSGALVSEFPLDTPPKRHHFPQRNRIISGLSLGVLVVEAAKKSGSLITAFSALEQNREVFAVPGNIFSKTSKGSNRLIQLGAKAVSSAQDILDEYNITYSLPLESAKAHNSNIALNEQEKKVYHTIGSSLTTIDQIISTTGLTYAQITGILFTLEMASLIQTIPGGYQRV